MSLGNKTKKDILWGGRTKCQLCFNPFNLRRFMGPQHKGYSLFCLLGALSFGSDRRIKHFISALEICYRKRGSAMQQACQKVTSKSKNLVAPKIDPEEGLPYHEWFIEFKNSPRYREFDQKLDQSMQEQNVYYEDLLKGRVLRTLVITTVADGGFQQYMKSIGKLGGQNKVPRLSNDRKIVDKLPLK